MIIYTAFAIPFLTCFILYFRFNHKMTWWEFILPFAASAITIFTIKYLTESIQLRTIEYWGSFIQRVEYHEDWDEWINQTCYRECCCDSKGNNCSQESYDCSYRQYHPPMWIAITNIGETIEINADCYNYYKKRLGNEFFVEMNRDYYSDDGDQYFSQWKHDSLTAIPITTIHHYDNRIKAADQSIFHFKDVDTSDINKFKLKKYPTINQFGEMDALIGEGRGEDFEIANKKLQYINAFLGPQKEVRIFVLVFRDQPLDAAMYQEAYWSGGNMNEFVVAIGLDQNDRVTWCYPFSWTPSERLKVEVKSFVQDQEKINFCLIADYLLKEVNQKFIRRNFEEFDYLTVEPSPIAIFITFLATLLFNFLASFYAIRNDYQSK